MSFRTISGFCLLLAGIPGCTGRAGQAQAESVGACHAPAPDGHRVLVFSRTTGFRHGSIAAGTEAIRRLGEQLNFAVDHTEDPSRFSDDGLAAFSAVVFLNTTGDPLDDAQQAAFERFIRAGGGYVGVHSAADTEYDWPWYGRLVGAWFLNHPAIQEGRLAVDDATHPSTRCVPDPWVRTDEWYDFRAPPAEGVSVLLTIDEGSYQGGRMGARHPMAWHHAFDGGRAWYTALGHTTESYAEPAFLDHLAGGILWAMGVERARSEGTRD